ncbi:MAG: AraC family transcriptional regulator [Flavobacteriales bacterium]
MIQYFEIDTKATEAFVQVPPSVRQRSFHEIMWVQKGNVHFMVDGDIYEVKANSFFILPKDRYHRFLPQEGINGQVIRFSEEDLDVFPKLLFSKFHNLSEVKLSNQHIQFFEQLYSLIQSEYVNKSDSKMVLIQLIKSVIYKLDAIKRNEFNPIHQVANQFSIVDAFQDLLDLHILENRSIHFYAEQLNMTSRKLGAIIKSVFNTTTENIVAQRLLIEAKRQLVYSEKNIAQIAYDLNFQDNSYFTKYFKKHTSLTPKQYRENQQIVK